MKSKRKQKNCKPPRIPILPRETLEIVERGEILLCGVLGIEDYCPCLVRVKTSKGIIEFSGSAMTLCWAGEKRLLLRGNLENLAFLGR